MTRSRITLVDIARNSEIPLEDVRERTQHFLKCLVERFDLLCKQSRGTAKLKLLDWARQHLAPHFKLPPSKMHTWLSDELDRLSGPDAQRGEKLNVLAPRGGAKSTIATLAFPLRQALEIAEDYIWIVSDTKHQAETHLANVKAELENNQALAELYPNTAGRGKHWSSSRIMTRGGTVIEAIGTGCHIRGKRHQEHRPSLIICDDLQNDEQIRSLRQREKAQAWFDAALLRAGNPKTNVINLATALHREAIAMRLTKTPGWRSEIFRAIEHWPKDMRIWNEWEQVYRNVENEHHLRDANAFYEAHKKELNEGAELLWPEHESLLTLMQMRVQSGAMAFAREKQNSPIHPDHCEWPENYFDDSIWFDEWVTEPIIKAIALDPSKGGNVGRGDYSAFVSIAIDQQSIVYADADLARRPMPQIVNDGVELIRDFQPHIFAVEINQFQELLATLFDTAFREHQLADYAPVGLRNFTNKTVRIRRLGPLLASGRLRFKRGSPGAALLVEQLSEFPIADHDDGPDALEMAVRVASEWLGEQR